MKHPEIPRKTNDTSIRVLEILKYMVMNDIDLSDIEYNIPEFASVLPETYLKYFATIDYAGLPVRKIDKKYTLCSLPVKINLSEDELNIFRIICSNFKSCCSDKDTDTFIKFFRLISKSLNGEQRKIFEDILKNFVEKSSEISEVQEKCSIYEDYVSSGQRLKITYKDQVLLCEPKTIDIINGNIYFNVYDFKNGTFKKILTDLITSVEVMPTRASLSCMNETAVFTVYNRLVDNYRLRENEFIQSFNDKSKTIVVKNFDREELMKRLLKYGENCKIISPKNLQKDFLCLLYDIRQKIKDTSDEKNCVDTDR